MKIIALLLLLMTTCSAPPAQQSSPDYALADPVYVVLAQKALTYQTDFDIDAWADMLADSVVYWPPDSHPPWRGKAAVVAGWQRWRQTAGVQTLRLLEQTHLPLVLAQGLGPWHKPGVYVLSWYRVQAALGDGRRPGWRLSQYCHFDTHKRIDVCMALQ